MVYELLRLRSEDGETREVIFHMCIHDGVDSLEILAPNGGVIITRECAIGSSNSLRH